MPKELSKLRSMKRRLAGITMPIHRKRMRWMRNWPCLCGSKNKYKRCCMQDIEKLTGVDGNSSIPDKTQELPKTRQIRDLILGDTNEG